MEVGSARCADRTPQRGVPTRNGRTSGYRALYSGLEDRRLSLNTYVRWESLLELIERLLCHTTSVVQGLRLEMNDALASAEYRSAVVNRPRYDVLKAALRSIRSLSSVEHAQFSQLTA